MLDRVNNVRGDDKFSRVGQYVPPSLVWSQLVIFSGMIFSTTRFGALSLARLGR